jgi:heme-degrading monooxygenase HmoA
MVIGEAISDEQVHEFARIYASEILPQLKSEPGFASAELMIEEGGRMAVSLTVWFTREDCFRYHSSRAYRQFVAKTQHLLVGDFVVKLFKEYSS